VQHIDLFDVNDRNNNMRNSGVNEVNGFVFVADREGNIQLQIGWLAQVQSHDLAMKLRRNDPSGCLKRNFFACVGDLFYETGKTTRAIAAHFRFAAVAVVVAHPKISAVSRGLDQQNSIRPNPAMTIANFRDLLRSQMHFAGTIVDHDKVVPLTIHLGESQHVIRVTQGCLNTNREMERAAHLPGERPHSAANFLKSSFGKMPNAARWKQALPKIHRNHRTRSGGLQTAVLI
jgi:hypothetical protein